MTNIFLRKNLSGAAGVIPLDVTMEIAKGEMVGLYGASGAGKTSILRMIAGVLTPDRGMISVNGETWFDSERKISLRPQHRSAGIVFQDSALFPNMTVLGNIQYGLARGESPTMADELIELMELTQLRKKRPQFLSGGQKQRVALARAIAAKPSLLLLDEPLAALDTELRLRMQQYIQQAHRTFGFTTILVSHDILELYRLSTKVFVLEQGRIVKSGSPDSVLPIQKVRDMLAGLDSDQ